MIDSLMAFRIIKVKPTVSPKRAAFYSLASAFFFFLFVIFTLLVRANLFNSFDFNMTHRLQNNIPLRLDPYFSTFSILGRFEFTIIVLGLILLLRRQIFGILIFGIFGFAHIIEIIGKSILEHPGPPNMFLRSHFTDFPGLYVHTQASYPSGHSMRIVILGILIAAVILEIKKLPKFLRALSLAGIGGIVFMMLLSRVSLGEHWTTDVIGGALLGLSTAFLSLIFL